MSSTLIIIDVKDLQKEINKLIKLRNSIFGIYVSLNKTHEDVEKILKNSGVDTRKLFFIDCVTNERKEEDVLHVRPTDLDKLSYIINVYIKEIPGKKFLLIDALSTLLIYNGGNKVAQFIKSVTEYSAIKDVEFIALSPKTEGEDVLDKKIFNFFNEVKED
ncbi:MAG: hypothetical protein WC758_01640 [Candidatus Woesearchaeota archaeon]|jgi:KaiC/GvpD/RAD55 family RecA-like ATPase